MEQTELIVNGQTYPILYEKNWNLLYVLREVLGLTGTKCGCGTNDCGACRVIVDGEAKNSCVLMVRNLAGKRIETIEGLSRGTQLHPNPAGVHRRGRRAVRLLHAGNDHEREGAARPLPGPHGGGDPRGAGAQPLPLHGVREDRRGGPAGCQEDARGRRRSLRAQFRSAARTV